MDSDKKDAPEGDSQASKDTQQAPVDALSRSPDDLDQERAAERANSGTTQPTEKKISPIKLFFRKANVYLLMFVLVLVVAIVISAVTYLNSTKPQAEPTIASQELTEEALKQLANTDASVGNSSQTLTIQGNAIIAGQTLMRGNLNIAGNLQTGGTIQGPNLTISGTSNLGTAQINSLQVATNTAVQGTTTTRDLAVSGTASFSGPVTASQITTTNLILSGNAVLQIPNHISFTGPTPARASVNGGVLGTGGSASISGSDTAGTINVNTGNNPTAGCFAQFTFNQRFNNSPRVVVSPIDAGAGQTSYYVTRNNTGFSICTATPAPANQTFAYDYFITN